MMYKLYKVFLLFLVCSVLTVGAFAQNANSSINGTVKDASGAVVPGATVTLTDVGTNQPAHHDHHCGRLLRFYQSVADKLQFVRHRVRVCRLGRFPDLAGFSSCDGQCNSECRQRIDKSHRKGRHSTHRHGESDPF